MRLRTILIPRTLSVFALTLGLNGVANAGVMNFETAPTGGFLTTPFEQDGVRLSVIGGHYDLY